MVITALCHNTLLLIHWLFILTKFMNLVSNWQLIHTLWNFSLFFFPFRSNSTFFHFFIFLGVIFSRVFLFTFILIISGNCVLSQPGHSSFQVEASSDQQNPTAECGWSRNRQSQLKSHSWSAGVAKYFESRHERWTFWRWKLRFHHGTAEHVFDAPAFSQKPTEESKSPSANETAHDWTFA